MHREELNHIILSKWNHTGEHMRTDREDQDSNIYPLTQGGKDSGKRKKNLNATHSLITTSVDQHVFIVKEMKMTDCVKILCQKHLYEKKNRCQVRTKLFAVCKKTKHHHHQHHLTCSLGFWLVCFWCLFLPNHGEIIIKITILYESLAIL